MNPSKSCSGGSTFRPFMSHAGVFDKFPMSSMKMSSSIDKGKGVWSSISSFDPCFGVVSYSNSTLVGKVGISEASGYVMIDSSSDMVGCMGCRSASGVTQRIFSKINFPSSTVQCTKTPPMVISRYSADSVIRLCTKCWMNIASRIDNSGSDMASCLYRDQATPKLIMEINDLQKWEECKAELILQNDQTAMTTTDIELVPLFSPSR
jgi:hypothetical protein